MAWTHIDLDTSWQDLPIALEIWEQYRRRYAILAGLHYYPDGTHDVTGLVAEILEPDSNVTVFDFIAEMQENIERMATNLWIDPNINITGVYNATYSITIPAPDDALILTKDEYMTLAGLTETGYWRRVDETDDVPTDWDHYDGAGFAYGRIEDKDMAGPWLFTDLQVALTQMTRMYLPATVTKHRDVLANTAASLDSEPDWNACTDAPVTEDAYTGWLINSMTEGLSVTKSRWNPEYPSSSSDGSAYDYVVYKDAGYTEQLLSVELPSAVTTYIGTTVGILTKVVVVSRMLFVPGPGTAYMSDIPAECSSEYVTQALTPEAAFDISIDSRDLAVCADMTDEADAKLPSSRIALGSNFRMTYSDRYVLAAVIADFNFGP